ncbi:LysR family transcriptional regulator [Hahella sp. KA22]|uniref:LysR family transcriptional regulator n=1 Tax=Hahella sp. KA22 TaxID=1628392 RepID=UPI000FDD988B|nr:LysR family transcriptional regulator [Hahella sp. KA22]AZZ92380.1 LysR family transcriptional regulator [Hahella sp. KA22]QAY55754.1 LysR family transcriptional regulator [Hahella sp. KA22]
MHICMEWRPVNFDWNQARAFLVTAEEGSLSAAARALGISQPTLSRQVSALEKELSVALFERGAKGLELTPNGLALLGYVRAMGEAAGGLSMAASGHARSVEGTIVISATEVTAAFILPSIIMKLRALYPGLHIDIIASNIASDLKRREADIAIRAFRPTQPDLIARKLSDIKAALYAAPSYLDRIGRPKTPKEFSNAHFLGFSTNNDAYIKALKEHGFELSDKNFPVKTDGHLAHWEMTKQGLGIGIGAMPIEIGMAPSVERALPNYEAFKGESWLVSHRELKMNLRVRTVFDFLVGELS